LSQKGVVAGIPPSFLDLLDKAVVAAESYRPVTEAELEELKRIAGPCLSVFQQEDGQAAHALPSHMPAVAGCPYGGAGQGHT
jgi:hypothetical protein